MADLIGKVYGKWRVAAIINAGPWPWAWLVRVGNPQVQARISVHSLHTIGGA